MVNVVTKLELTDLDGDTILFLPLTCSTDPVLGDVNILVCQADLEQAHNINGGITRFLTGLPGYFVVLLLDKGFLVHQFNPSNRTLTQFFQQISNQTNRLKVFAPLTPNDHYLDDENLLPAGTDPINIMVNNVQRRRAKRLIDREANSTRVSVTMTTWIVEASYSCDWGMAITGKKKTVPYQYLKEANFQPATKCSKMGVILYASMVLKNRYHQPFRLTFPLAPCLSYADLGLRACERVTFRNPLDPINQVQWPVIDLSGRRTVNQLWQPLNLMNINATGMSYILPENLIEISLGPYAVNLMYGYVTSIQVNNVMLQHQYANIDQYNAAYRQMPLFVIDLSGRRTVNQLWQPLNLMNIMQPA